MRAASRLYRKAPRTGDEERGGSLSQPMVVIHSRCSSFQSRPAGRSSLVGFQLTCALRCHGPGADQGKGCRRTRDRASGYSPNSSCHAAAASRTSLDIAVHCRCRGLRPAALDWLRPRVDRIHSDHGGCREAMESGWRQPGADTNASVHRISPSTSLNACSLTALVLSADRVQMYRHCGCSYALRCSCLACLRSS